MNSVLERKKVQTTVSKTIQYSPLLVVKYNFRPDIRYKST